MIALLVIVGGILIIVLCVGLVLRSRYVIHVHRQRIMHRYDRKHHVINNFVVLNIYADVEDNKIAID